MAEDAVTIHSLPTEVLAHIFRAGTTLSLTCPGCLPCLVTYSAVCAAWRSAALTPHLWANINADVEMQNIVELVALCLKRSKSCFFNVTLRIPPDNAPAYMSVVTGVMLLVVQHVHRLRRLAIKADSSLESDPEEIFALLQNAQTAPHLEVLELSFSDPNPNVGMAIPSGGLLMQTPSLCSLRLHSVASPVPFVGLRSLDIEGLRTSYADFRDMIVASPLLTELILPKLRFMVDLQSKALPPIEIPSLKRLAVSFWKPPPSHIFNPCHSLLSLLSIPNLEYLELVGGGIPDLAQCFRDPCTFTNLRTLRLASLFHHYASQTDPSTANCAYLRALTTVEELHLIDSYAEYLLPTEHTRERGPEGRLPRTRSINFRDGTGSRAFHILPRREGSRNGLPQLPDSAPIYPNLRSITLDTLSAGGAMWLYRFVLERPQIEVVNLSPVTERHFATSLGMVDGVLRTLPNMRTRELGVPESVAVNVGELLRQRVLVKEIEMDGYIQ
ncbi:hypothetical protein C8R44DRAFT_802715 [Mycena epipterygia]|nr:hypothetical protein C8R44DRAFT_802715 [Mycena epipterygia]